MLNTSLINWQKVDGLLPVIVQHAQTGQVLMLGYMNDEALAKTINEGKVTFYSRTNQRLWTKGETSGNFLHVVDMSLDCDNDTLLILANPIGATCHTGEDSCFHRFHACLPGMNHKKIQRLMRELELQVRVRKSKKLTTYRGTIGYIAPNHLERYFTATKPNQKWVTDVTEFKAKDGNKVYLSPILDLFNNEIVSYTPVIPQTGHRWRKC